MIYRVNGRTVALSGLYHLPRVEVGPADQRRAAASPLSVLQIVTGSGSYRLTIDATGQPHLRHLQAGPL